MLEKFRYINHINETLEFGSDGLYVNSNDLRNYSWDVTTSNNKISSFKKGVVSKTIPLVIRCNNESEGVKIKNRLFEIFEKDVLAKEHGRIIIGDYYLKCYITGSKKSEYLYDKSYLKLSLTLKTDYSAWIKETTTVFNNSSSSVANDLDYNFDYPHDYKSALNVGTLNNTDFVASNFIIRVFGFVTNPTLYINGHEYNVNVDISTGEYLTIDSLQKTIVLTRYNGEKVNCFNKRNKDSYIFEKIAAGTNIVNTEGTFLFTVTLIEERSEPKWI